MARLEQVRFKPDYFRLHQLKIIWNRIHEVHRVQSVAQRWGVRTAVGYTTPERFSNPNVQKCLVL